MSSFRFPIIADVPILKTSGFKYSDISIVHCKISLIPLNTPSSKSEIQILCNTWGNETLYEHLGRDALSFGALDWIQR